MRPALYAFVKCQRVLVLALRLVTVVFKLTDVQTTCLLNVRRWLNLLVCDVSVRMPTEESGDLTCRFLSRRRCRSSCCHITPALSTAVALRLSQTWSPRLEPIVCHLRHNNNNSNSNSFTTIKQVSQHPQLRTGGFSWSKVVLPTCPCWWQLVHLTREMW